LYSSNLRVGGNGLRGNSRQAFVPTEQNQNIKYTRGSRLPG
jgi:hypothetical protein